MSQNVPARRTHTCGALRGKDISEKTVLMGWIASRRDLGSLCFIDLRDRYGITQVRFDTSSDQALLDVAHRLRPEYVVAVEGVVNARPDGMVNQSMDTGEVEVEASSVHILSEAKTAAFEIDDENQVSEDLRLKYRYLDLRRGAMQKNLIRRHRMVLALRQALSEQDFIDVETPGLTLSMPEGARDYLVPSRVHAGKFYALPQSPQLFKQLLMVSGFDRYFQIVKCFRDEDLRADRQPEFTQLDLEMSFGNEEDVFSVVEQAVKTAVKAVCDVEITTPFPRITHADSMARYGVDKPDLRYELEIVDMGELALKSDFKVLKGAVESGGVARGIRVPGGASWSRKQIDSLEALAKDFGAMGLAWTKVNGPTDLSGPLSRFFVDEMAQALCQNFSAGEGDLIVVVASTRAVVEKSLGEVRKEIANRLELTDPKELRFCWVTEFPMFDRDEETGTLVSSHHPFTMPDEAHEGQLESDPTGVTARSYDLVLNGWELGSGGIRIHESELQSRVFRALGIGEADAQERFGFLLEAFGYGAPPHCGIALGIDRLAALLVGASNIREVVAFPKTASAACLMTGAPGIADGAQLEELGISIKETPSE